MILKMKIIHQMPVSRLAETLGQSLLSPCAHLVRHMQWSLASVLLNVCPA